MKELNLTLSTEDKPLYLRITDAIRKAIRKGYILPGEKIPSTREWAKVLKVHRHTVMSSLNELVAEGWLIAEERFGYKVCDTLPTLYLNFESSQKRRVKSVQPHQWSNVRPVYSLEQPSRKDYQFYFRGGAADIRLFPHNELKTHLSDSLKYPSSELLDYGNPQGHPPLIQSLDIYLRRMRAITGKTIIITHGSQEAIYLCGQVLLQPGDVVAIEALGYPPAWDALRSAGAQLVALEQDEQGVDPDSLLKLVKHHKIKLIYLSPLHQYPTTVTVPIPRRMQIYEIAAQYDIPILEDDYDHEFHFRCQPLAPLSSDDPRELVIYVSTFSKVLFPSARIGFMAVPDNLAQLIIQHRKIISYQQETLLQDAVARWMESGGLERHLRRMCNTYEQRRNVMIECLDKAIAKGMPLAFHRPDGGMAIWLNTFKNTALVTQKAEEVGIFVHPEYSFRLDQASGTHLRIGYANHTPEELGVGVQKLLKVIESV